MSGVFTCKFKGFELPYMKDRESWSRGTGKDCADLEREAGRGEDGERETGRQLLGPPRICSGLLQAPMCPYSKFILSASVSAALSLSLSVPLSLPSLPISLCPSVCLSVSVSP